MCKLFKFGAVLLCCAVIAEALLHSSSAKEVEAWYVKRNGNLMPGFPCDTDILDKYGCYYIDKDANQTSKKKLYLTFDAGYDNGNLDKILDVLNEENVPAAFFVLKNLIEKDRELVLRMANEGHLVCNHTAYHKNLTSSTKEEIVKELTELEASYTKETGLLLSKYFRFPEGKYSLNALKEINSLGYKTVFWSFAYEDWDNNNQPSEAYAIKKILDNTHDGAVILLHPNSSTNAKILPTIIKIWRDQGYEFCTLDELVKNN